MRTSYLSQSKYILTNKGLILLVTLVFGYFCLSKYIYRSRKYHEYMNKYPFNKKLFPKNKSFTQEYQMIYVFTIYFSSIEAIRKIQYTTQKSLIARINSIVFSSSFHKIYLYIIGMDKEFGIWIIPDSTKVEFNTFETLIKKSFKMTFTNSNQTPFCQKMCRIFDLIAKQSNYSFLPESGMLNKSAKNLAPQYFMIFDTYYHVPKKLFTTAIDDVFKSVKHVVIKHKKSFIPIFIELKGHCDDVNLPSLLCNIWNLWRSSQLSMFLNLTAARGDARRLFSIFANQLHSGAKTIYKFRKSLFKNQNYLKNYTVLKLGRIYIYERNKAYASVREKFFLMKINDEYFSHYFGILFRKCFNESCKILIKFDHPMYISQIYIRWESNFLATDKLAYKYRVSITKNTDVVSDKREYFLKPYHVMTEISLTIQAIKEQNDYYLNELIILF